MRATPERVIDTLTDPEACARWSPIPFSVDAGDTARLRPGAITHVSGRLLGARIRFALHTLVADAGELRLRACGPIEIVARYRLAPIKCRVRPRRERHDLFDRARLGVRRIAREAESAA